MTEQEFLIKSRELMKIVRKSLQLCDNIQKELNEDYENKLISYEEWKKKTEENRLIRESPWQPNRKSCLLDT